MIKAECRNIYRNVFCDPDTSFEDMLFSECFEYCRFYKTEDKVASMLFLLPIELTVDGKKINGSYLYAAATAPEYRSRGFMGRLLERAKEECDFILLRPAESSLIDYYASFGFQNVTAGDFADVPEALPQGGYKRIVDLSKSSDNRQQFTAMYYSKAELKLEKINFNYSMN